jgi:hypothetical protein
VTPTPAPGPTPPTTPGPSTPSGPESTPAGTSEGARLIAEALRAERGGDLQAAARALGRVPAGTPEAGQAASRLRSLAGNAQQRASQARDRAEQANAVGNDEFLSASRSFTEGRRVASQNPQQAIEQFLSAEAGFNRAREVRPAQPTTPSTGPQPPAPVPGPTIPPEVKPATPTPITPAPVSPPVERKEPEPRPVAPTPAPAPVPDNSAEKSAVDRVVRQYFTARSTLDVARILQVYPGLPADRERSTLRSIQGACSEYSEAPVDVNVMSVDGQEAVVRTRAQTTCKQKAGGQTRTTDPYRVFFELKKVASGTWQITTVNRPDQAK